jgi:hypothetical protein
MPRYYQYGYQGPAYAYNWKGIAPRQSQAAALRSLSDVTDASEFFSVPKSGDPYYLHKKEIGPPPSEFRIPRKDDPYYLHKYGSPTATSGFAGDLMDRPLVLAGVAAAVWFLWKRRK